ncbi:hypothetical protein WA026_008109 [Henosepilachna vigintioctopunctata]|uniref:ABC transmembrane type-1 domain-containing protein n=1 Tax=Henosepilachna vigintioctopunctata TaxID=420089 RepID=A0AAW1TQB7_9CUCU
MDRGYGVERKKHPKDSASIFSLLSFSYIHPYIRRGNKKDLDEDDVCKVWSKLQSKHLGDKIETLWSQQEVGPGKTKSVFKLLFDRFWKTYLFLGLIQLAVKIVYVSLTPLSVGKLVNYFKEGQKDVTKNEAWLYGTIVIFTNSVFLFYEHHYILLKAELAMKMAVSLSSLIYRKTLKLSPSKLQEISTGKIVTAITKDISQVEEAVYFINDLWVELIQAAVVMYLLHNKLGTSALTGLSIILFIVVIQVYTATLILKKRKEVNDKTDKRLQLTQEILTAIKVLKMYAWETFFARKTMDLRKKEIRSLRTLTILKFFSDFLGSLCNKLSFLLLILFYIWFGNNLTAEVVYYITTCFFRLRRTIEFIIPYCCAIFAELIAGLRRIEIILNADEIEQDTYQPQTSLIVPTIEIISAEVEVDKTLILKDINVKLKPGLNVLIGPVGSGKSSY